MHSKNDSHSLFFRRDLKMQDLSLLLSTLATRSQIRYINHLLIHLFGVCLTPFAARRLTQ